MIKYSILIILIKRKTLFRIKSLNAQFSKYQKQLPGGVLLKNVFLKYLVKLIEKHGSMTCDLYFMIQVEFFMSHILIENMYFTNHREITGLKTCNTFLLLISSIIYFSIEQKFCEHNFLRTCK